MKASGLTKCPVHGCPHSPEPWFCSEHWARVSSEVRRRIIAEAKTLRGRGTKDLPPKLVELLTEAVEESA